MNYYIDFDSTLFDTTRFYKELKKIMQKYGLTEEMIVLYQQKFTYELFNPFKIIEYYLKQNIIKKDILKDIDSFIENLSSFLYEDTIPFLKKNKNHTLILFTYGSYDYQKKKIIGTNIEKYFQGIIITEKKKSTLDIPYTKSVFIDDNPKVINDLLKQNVLRMIRIKRKNNKYIKEEINEKIEEYNNLIDIEL